MRLASRIAGLGLVLLLAPALRSADGLRAAPTAAKSRSAYVRNEAAVKEAAMTLYNEMDLASAGLSMKAFQCAYKGYRYLAERGVLSSSILTICDFSQSSRHKRMYILDVLERKVLLSTYVAHGRGSGGEFARSFSNGNRSHKSSLGFYLTDHTYYGRNGLSLRLRGLERGFNDQALRRAIVVHGSEYIGDDFVQNNPFNGRSYGCPAVPEDVCQEVIDTIKDGSCLFIYSPVKKYLTRSRILNS